MSMRTNSVRDMASLFDEGRIIVWRLELPSWTAAIYGAEHTEALLCGGRDPGATAQVNWGEYLAAHCHPEDVERAVQDIESSLEDGRSYSSHYRTWDRKRDDWRRWHAFGRTRLDPESGGFYILAGMQDISERRVFQEAAEEVRKANERVRIMLDATPLCCNFWDGNYKNIDCNQAAADLFDLSSKDEYLQCFDELSPVYQPCGRLSKDLSLEKIRSAFDSGYERFEWMHRKLDGELIPAEITLVRVRYGDGYMVAGYTRDLRELKAMLAKMETVHEELRTARDGAEESARAKSEFLANMSHEIRTPMNAILGMTHLVLQTDVSERQRYYLDKVKQSAKLLLRIINDILDFSRIEAGRLEVEETDFALDDVLRDVSDLVIEEASAKDLCMAINVDPSIPAMLTGDPLRLSQVLLNLVGNAIKFTPAGRIEISVSEAARSGAACRLLFTVRDTGIGMNRDQIDALFAPFTQMDTSSTRRYGGTGLGLAICKSLVSLMGGRIWCESEPGNGSSFHFTSEFTVPDLREDETAGNLLEPLSALLIGDNDAALAPVRMHLNLLRCPVAGAFYGAAALDALAPAHQAGGTGNIQLIVMDFKNVTRDGAEAYARLAELFGDAMPPILYAISGYGDGDPGAFMRRGCWSVIQKPVTLSSLYDAIVQLLRKTAPDKKDEKTPAPAKEDAASASAAAALPDAEEEPRLAAEADVPAGQTKKKAPYAGRILLAEDNEINQILAVELLASEGFETDVASNGRLVLELLEQEGSYDAVLMDIQMPEMDGLAATRAIRANPRFRDLPIIAMTAHAMSGDRELSLEAGMNDHVTKPIDPLLLSSTLKRWINVAA